MGVNQKLRKVTKPGTLPVKERRVHYHGIVADARRLGVSYPHLWQVLTGRRESVRLVTRYLAMQRERGAK
jgi:hypothetical protein